MKTLSILASLAVWTAPAIAVADPMPSPVPAAASTVPASGGGHSYDPCEMVSQADIASAAGVAANQVYTPKKPTRDECVWAIGNKTGIGGQQVALTVQTVGQVQQARGFAKFSAILKAAQSIPGVPLNNPIVSRVFADAQVVSDLGDRAGWKNGTLSVLKNELLFQVNVAGQPGDGQALAASKAVAKAVLQHMQTQ
jgi:hypothetical protein